MNTRRVILVVVGSRPEAIKLAPVIRCLNEDAAAFRTVVCSTGQQRDLIVPALAEFGIAPDVDLDVMRSDASLAGLTARLLPAIDGVLGSEAPDWVVVQGDTTSAMAGALAAFYRRIPVAHVEAGLRTDDRFAPFPEEINRRIITQCADLHFAPTTRCADRLEQEGVPRAQIHVTGNTVVDALLWMRSHNRGGGSPLPTRVIDAAIGRRMVLVTLHRRENWGDRITGVCDALLAVVREMPDLMVAFPVHPNPRVRNIVETVLGGHPRICLMPPQPYAGLVDLMDRAFLILTDSGGIQEEAPTFGTPVLVLRDRTERPEGIEAGVAALVGTETAAIVTAVRRLASHPADHARMSTARNPYGDGRSSARVRAALLQQHGTAQTTTTVPVLTVPAPEAQA